MRGSSGLNALLVLKGESLMGRKQKADPEGHGQTTLYTVVDEEQVL